MNASLRTGQRGYVQIHFLFWTLDHLVPLFSYLLCIFQNVFSRTKKVINPSSIGAICVDINR